MKIINKFFHFKILYIFFIFLSLIIFFLSTVKSEAKAFEINDIDIATPFEMNFDKNEIIEKGFKKAFFELISLIVSSQEQNKIKEIKLNEIKGMVESFSIKEEKFIDEIYYVNLGVTFNRKKIFNYLEKKNIFPSIPKRKKILFIPIIIDENKKDLLIFSNNKIFDEWNKNIKRSHLIDYILPSEDLEDLKTIKEKFDFIEQYDFHEITKKYFLQDSIVALIFKNKNGLRVLSRINIKDQLILRNKSFKGVALNSEKQVVILINELKKTYEDYLKNTNRINTSIKLSLNIKVSNENNYIIFAFEELLNETDSISNYNIMKFDKNFTYYRIIYNGTSNIFLKNMKEKNYEFDTQNKIWILK